MVVTWDSVASNPAYQALPQEQKDAARQQYFNDVVAPQIPKEHLDIAKKQFDAYSTPKSSAPQEPGLMSRIGTDFSNRGTGMAEALLSNMKGEQGLPSTALQIAGGTGGALMDIGTETAKSLTPKFVKNGAESGAQGVANAIDSTSTGQRIGDSLLQGKNAIENWAHENPVAAKNAEALLNIQGAAPALSGFNTVRKGLAEAGDKAALSLAKPAVESLSKFEGAVPSEAVKNSSQNAYKYSENVGGVLHPDNFTNNVLDMIDEAKPQPLPGGGYTDTQKALLNSLNDYAGMRDHPMTLEQFQNFDKSLTAKESAAMKDFVPTDNSRIIGQLQDKIRDRLKNLKDSDVIGGKEGFNALTEDAIPLWSAHTKISDLEDLINRANGTLNPAQAQKSALNNLINSPKFNQYPAATQQAIRKAAQRGSADELLGMIGSRLNPIVSNTLTGKVINTVTAGAARKVKNAIQNEKSAKILSSLTDPVRGSVERFSTLPESPYPLKPEIPVDPVNPYFNPNSKVLDKYLPNNAGSVELGPVDPVNPEPQGTSSLYFKNGGHVRKNLTAEFMARADR